MKKVAATFLALALAMALIPSSVSSPALAVDRSINCSLGGSFPIVGTTIGRATGTCAGEITIPADVTIIGFMAFMDRNITSVTFEAGSQLKEMKNFAFANTKFTTIDLPDGLETMDSKGFQYSKLVSISIPGSVNLFYGEMFEDALDLETVVFETRTATSLVMASNLFKGARSLKSFTWMGGQTGSFAGYTITNKPNNVWKGWSTSVDGPIVSHPYQLSAAGTTLYTNFTPDVITEHPCSLGGTFRTVNTAVTQSTLDCAGEITIPQFVAEVNAQAFKNRQLTVVNFEPGSKLVSLREEAFADSTLTSIDLPDGVRWLYSGVFARTQLTSISLPASSQYIYQDVFRSTPLETLVFESGAQPSFFDDNALRETANLKSVTWVGGKAFGWNHGSITKPNYEWKGWSTSVDGPIVTTPYQMPSAGVTLYPIWKLIVTTVFECSAGGTFTTLNETLSSSTENCAGEVTIPAYVTKIGSSAFDRRALTSVLFEADSQLKEIGEYAFQRNQFTSIDLPTGLEKISYQAFFRSQLTSISIPGTVTSLEGESFHQSHSIETVVFERRIASTLNAPLNAFERLGRLKSVTYLGPIQLNTHPAARKDAATFVGWSDSVAGPLVSFPLTVGEAGITLYTNYTNPITRGALFRASGGKFANGAEDLNGTVVGGEFNYPEPPTRRGWTFRGWTDPGSSGWNPLSYWDRTDNAQLSAFWDRNSYILTFDSKGGTPVTSITFLTEGLQRVNEPAAPTRPGYTFKYWSRTADGERFYLPTYEGVTDDLTLQAQWEANRHDVNFDSKGGSYREPVSFVTDGQIKFSPSAPNRPGYTLAGWSASDNGSILSFPYAPGVIGAITLYANWTPNTYSVIYDSKGGSAVAEGSFVTEGQIASAPIAPTRDGYGFIGWSATENGEVVSFPYAPGVMEPITLQAKWIKLFAVAFDSNGGSAVEVTYFAEFGNLSAAPQATTRRGFTFAGWSATDGGTAVTFPYAPGVSEDITLYALWTVNVYAVTYEVSGGVAVPNGSFTVESEVQLVTPIRVGYTFNGWSATDGGSFISFPYAPGVVENITLYANWTRNPYKPELLANATVSGTGFQSTNMKAEFGSWSAFPDAVLSVQWYRCDKAVSAGLSSLAASAKCVVIPKATKTTYKVVVADELKYLTVLVQAKNSIGTTFTTAKSFRALALKAPTKGKLPDVDGSAIAKKPLTAEIGTWTSNPIAKTSVQWFRCEEPTKVSSLPVSESSECTAIKGATKLKYTLSKADEGKYVTAQVKAENTEGIAFTTAKSSRVALTPSSVNAPAISGSAQLNKTLTAGAGSWEAYPAAKTSFKWYRCNKPTTAGAKMFGGSSGCAAIKGATKNRYTVTASDRGKYISALVTAENAAGKATVTAESEQVAFAPSKTANPGISGSPAVDKTLTASPGRWTAFPEVSISFAWYRCSSPAVAGAEKFAGASGCVPIGGANQSSYTVKEADQGKYIAVLVKARNSAGSSSATSKSTAKVG